MDLNSGALEPFHPLIREWFLESFAGPTEIQTLAWPAIASGRHILAVAPTGSGKTLCAFLWAIDRLVTGVWPAGGTRVLYVSPLKALAADIRRNLLAPLARIEERMAKAGTRMQPIKVQVRTGDTPQSERQRMARRPPEILITTPESLNLLLSSPRAREILKGLRTVILDEIHAVISTKRGTHLATAVERLVPLAGEFQRIALSATVRPPERAAAFVGGYCIERGEGEVNYRARQVEVLQARAGKGLEVEVRFVPAMAAGGAEASVWPALVEECRKAIHAGRSTLLFTNTRAHAEKLTRLINEAEGEILAYAHHGSLSREIRTAVEHRLKRGELKAIVATSSLELGIDIGELDQVLLIQTPITAASALQRIGRSGHAVDRASRGLFLPLHGRDLLDAALMSRSVLERDIEEARPVQCPLDLLAQVLLSMTGVERWEIDRLYEAVRASFPYNGLSRVQFERVLEMLAGKYADSRIRELESRLSLDRLDNTVQAKRGALAHLYRSGGTIPDRGYFDLRLQGSRAKIGELDEEFVWERKVGDTFMLGTQSWRIRRIDHRSVEVTPWEGPVNATPFWKAERGGREFLFCTRLSELLERWNGRLDDPELGAVLVREHGLEERAACELISFLKRQAEATGTDLPHRHHLLLEHVQDPTRSADMRRVILHTLWGARVNQPLAFALEAVWDQERGGGPLEVHADDSCLLAFLPEGVDLERLLRQVRPESLEALLRRSLESSGFFGARFRENAGRALLLPRSDFRNRVPLWLTRLRSKKLLEAVLSYPDFPILAETWRTCLQDEFDLDALKVVLEELAQGRIRISESRTPFPSPFAQGVSWIQTNQLLYADDSLPEGRRSSLRTDVIREALQSARLRPRIDPRLAWRLQEKLQRTAPGYAPRDTRELLDWLKERLVLSAAEWDELLEAMRRDHALDPERLREELEPKLVFLKLPGAQLDAVCAQELLPRIRRALDDPESFSRLLAEWLRFYGPVDLQAARQLFGLSSEWIEESLDELAEEGTVVLDALTRDASAVQVCDAQNLEVLLRLTRKGERPSFRALGLEHLSLFLACHQRLAGISSAEGNARELQRALESLFGYPAPAEAWEEEIFPARLPRYSGAWLDGLLASSELLWLGCGRHRLTFCFRSDLELFLEPRRAAREELEALLPDLRGRFSFWDIREHSGLSSPEAVRRLWEAAWKCRAANDGFEVVRRGLLNGFSAEEPESRPGRRNRIGYDRWKASRPATGFWFALDPGLETEGPRDAVTEEELAKDRARQLLARYGILFRELLGRELPLLRWPAVFRALRLMELAGEVLSGHFFEGIPGLQFISPAAFSVLEKGLPADAVFWMCAIDPASPCGLGLPLEGLPPRLASNHLVFHGPRLILVSRSRGRELEIRVPPEEPELSRYLAIFTDHFHREFSPWNVVRVRSINGKEARDSPYRQRLLESGFTEEYRGLVLRARYGTS